jgi:hypothetical protein
LTILSAPVYSQEITVRNIGRPVDNEVAGDANGNVIQHLRNLNKMFFDTWDDALLLPIQSQQPRVVLGILELLVL